MDAKIFSTSASNTQKHLTSLQNWDFSPCYELALKLKQSPALLAEFAKDPEGVAKREVNYSPPPGFHMHFMDERLIMIPPEGEPSAQILSRGADEAWTRVEIRSGVGPLCIFNCGVCGNTQV